MIAWLEQVPTFLVAIAVIFVPGAAVAISLRQRGWRLLALSAPISISLIVVAAILGGWFSVPWSIVPVIGLTVIACIAGWAWSRFVMPTQLQRAPWRMPRWSSVVAVVIPAAVIGFTLVRAFQSPDLFAQRYDNFFHLNATQYVLHAGDASPFNLGRMTSAPTMVFYPSGWHALTSLVTQLSGATVVQATNVVILAVAAVVWPVSAIYLVRTLLGGSALATLATGVLASAFPAFPYLPLHYGPLYPLFLGLAVAPACIGLVVRLVRPGTVIRRLDIGLLLFLTVPGIAVAHPGALLGVLALGFAAVVIAAWVAFRSARSKRTKIMLVGGMIALIGIGLVILRVVRPPSDQIYWAATGSLAQAFGEVLTASPYGYPVAWMVAALMIVGVIVSLTHPTVGRVTAFAMAVVGSGLYIVVAGSTSEFIRMWLTGPWYNNAPRLASIWVLAVLPVTVLGAQWIVQTALRLVRARWVKAAVVSGAVLVGLAGAQGAAMDQTKADVSFTYGDGHGAGPILTQGEFDLMSRLDMLVPEDAVIAVNPWNGSGFAWGISGREVLMPHVLMDTPPLADIINNELDEGTASGALCDALIELDVRYALEFDGGDFLDHPATFDGLDELSQSDNVVLVAEEPGARLFKITACGLK